MMIKYKTGEFSTSIALVPGDALNLSLTTTDPITGKVTREKVHSEEIQSNRTYSHWIFADLGELPNGDHLGDAVFCGTAEIVDWFEAQFPNAKLIPEGELLFV